jgi:hypothetical protein
MPRIGRLSVLPPPPLCEGASSLCRSTLPAGRFDFSHMPGRFGPPLSDLVSGHQILPTSRAAYSE